MPTLTEQMQDLAADIRNGHEARRVWLGTLREEVGDMRHETRARLGDLREEVTELLEKSEAVRKRDAATARKDRKASLAALKKDTKDMLRGFSTDQEGARLAWRAGETLIGREPRPAKPKARARGTRRRAK